MDTDFCKTGKRGIDALAGRWPILIVHATYIAASSAAPSVHQQHTTRASRHKERAGRSRLEPLTGPAEASVGRLCLRG
jgi:hypothetical protein